MPKQQYVFKDTICVEKEGSEDIHVLSRICIDSPGTIHKKLPTLAACRQKKWMTGQQEVLSSKL